MSKSQRQKDYERNLNRTLIAQVIMISYAIGILILVCKMIEARH